MNLRNPKCLLAALSLFICITTSNALAALSFSTGANSSFDAFPGSSITIPIYVRDTAATIQVATDGGLFSAGFLVRQTTPVPTSPAAITSANINTTAFDTLDLALSSYSATTATVFEYQTNNATPAVPSAGLLQLGTVTIKLPNQAGQSTQYTIGDIDPTTTQFVTYNGNELDASIAGGFFTVASTAVPEPAEVSLLSAGGAVLLRRRLRSPSTASTVVA